MWAALRYRGSRCPLFTTVSVEFRSEGSISLENMVSCMPESSCAIVWSGDPKVLLRIGIVLTLMGLDVAGGKIRILKRPCGITEEAKIGITGNIWQKFTLGFFLHGTPQDFGPGS